VYGREVKWWKKKVGSPQRVSAEVRREIAYLVTVSLRKRGKRGGGCSHMSQGRGGVEGLKEWGR